MKIIVYIIRYLEDNIEDNILGSQSLFFQQQILYGICFYISISISPYLYFWGSQYSLTRIHFKIYVIMAKHSLWEVEKKFPSFSYSEVSIRRFHVFFFNILFILPENFHKSQQSNVSIWKRKLKIFLKLQNFLKFSILQKMFF